MNKNTVETKKATSSNERHGRSLGREIAVFFLKFFLVRVGLMYLALYVATAIIYNGGLIAYFKLLGTNFAEAFNVMSEIMITPIGYLIFIISAGLTIPIYLRFCLRKEEMSFESLGFRRKHIPRYCVIGYIVGSSFITLASLIWILLGYAHPITTTFPNIGLIVAFFFAFLAQGLSEEIAFRAYFFTVLSRRHNAVLSSVISSIAFALLHVLGGTVSLLTFFNLTLFGLFACATFARFHNIWLLGALHGACNFFENNVFGLGLSTDTTNASLLNYSVSGPNALITGGSYGGLWGSAIGTAVMLVAIIIILIPKMTRKNNI
ncbi:MAG: CPBP family intramembrane metalloprotease [Lachnospiraceae bacterium]|jgi:membrane protease YdiL (CAAX protease family)|nr:CPBP family intramembrane metalloprotease [Lachnospiraceae bacterium]